MNMRRAFSSSTALSFVIAIAAGIIGWGVPSVHAGQWHTALVTASGTVTGEREDVSFSGNVHIETRLALDPVDSTRDKIVVYVNLSKVTGQGDESDATYVVKGPVTVHHRLLAASDVIQVTFPFARSGSRWATRSGRASFSLDLDTATGAVLSAMGSIGNVR